MFCKNKFWDPNRFYRKFKSINAIAFYRQSLYTSCDLKNQDQAIRAKHIANHGTIVANGNFQDVQCAGNFGRVKKSKYFSTTVDQHIPESRQITSSLYDAAGSCHICAEAILANIEQRKTTHSNNANSNGRLALSEPNANRQLSLYIKRSRNTVNLLSKSDSAVTARNAMSQAKLENELFDLLRNRHSLDTRSNKRRATPQTLHHCNAGSNTKLLGSSLNVNDCVLAYNKLSLSDVTHDTRLLCSPTDKADIDIAKSYDKDQDDDGKLSKEKLEQFSEYVIDEWKKIINIGGDLKGMTFSMYDSKIYHPDIVLVNKWFAKPYIKKGDKAYFWEIKKLQTLLGIKYDNVTLQILTQVVNQNESSCKVRWRLLATKKSIMRSPLSSVTEDEVWLDGICVFYVNTDLYITKHVVEKFEKDKKGKMNVLYKSRLAKALGLEPADI